MRPDEIIKQIESLKLLYPELVEEEWEISLESETNLKEFLRQVERCRQDAAAMLLAIKTQRDTLWERAECFNRKEEAMRKLAFKLMEAAELRKVELPEATLSIANSKARVIITDENMLPQEFWRPNPEPDKTKIREHLESGEDIPGAAMSNAEPHLVVRIKAPSAAMSNAEPHLIVRIK